MQKRIYAYSNFPHKLTDQVREKLRVAGRAGPAGSEDKADGDSAACTAAFRRSGARQACLRAPHRQAA